MTPRDIPVVSVVGSIAIVFCFVLLVPISVAFYKINNQVDKIQMLAVTNRALVKQVANLTKQNHVVACATKHSTEQQIAASQHYLDEVRAGTRKRLPGISDNDFVMALRRQQTFLQPYERLVCKPPR